MVKTFQSSFYDTDITDVVLPYAVVSCDTIGELMLELEPQLEVRTNVCRQEGLLGCFCGGAFL